MMERKHYRFAGLEFQVEIPAEKMYREEYRMAPFLREAVSDPHRVTFALAETLPEPEGTLIFRDPFFSVYEIPGGHVRYIGGEAPYIRAEHRGKDHSILLRQDMFASRIGSKTVLDSLEVEHLIARNGGFLFHCAYIDWGGKAILFTAPSETGKSTQAELWKQYRGAEIINGDRAAVRLVDGVLTAEGIPFAGSSSYCKDRSLPVAAIVYLGQAPETSIRKLRGYQAFSKIWEGICVHTWDKTDLERVSAVVEKAASTVPVFHLTCTPDESAILALEDALRKLV